MYERVSTQLSNLTTENQFLIKRCCQCDQLLPHFYFLSFQYIVQHWFAISDLEQKSAKSYKIEASQHLKDY